MHGRTIRLGALALAALAIACCAMDVGKQLATDPKLQDQVMGVIATDGKLSMMMTDRLLANDSLRARVVDDMLRNSPSAQRVLYRIANNADAVDLVLDAAKSDSTMRRHLISKVKSWETSPFK